MHPLACRWSRTIPYLTPCGTCSTHIKMDNDDGQGSFKKCIRNMPAY